MHGLEHRRRREAPARASALRGRGGRLTAFLTYEREGDAVAMTHTIVPPPIEGRGIAGGLTRTAVDWARGEGLQIDPQCSYVRAWLRKHA